MFIVQTTAHICADQYSLSDFSKVMRHQIHTTTVPTDHSNTLAKVANYSQWPQYGGTSICQTDSGSKRRNSMNAKFLPPTVLESPC